MASARWCGATMYFFSRLEPFRVGGEVWAPPPDAVDVELVLVDSQLAPQVRPVLVAETAEENETI